MNSITAFIIIMAFVFVVILVVVGITILGETRIANAHIEGKADFENFYKKLQDAPDPELTNAWQEAKKEKDKRQKITKTLCLVVDIFLLVCIVSILISTESFKEDMATIVSMSIATLIVNVFILLVANLLLNKKADEYNKIYKSNVITKIINNFYEVLEYSPSYGMPEEDYKKLNYERYDRYRSEDYIEAKINNKYEIKMAEIKTEVYEETQDIDGQYSAGYKSVFDGLFAKVTLNKRVINELKIVKNGDMLFERKTTVDSTEFERKFDIITKDRMTAMQILTSDVMDKLLKFAEDWQMNFDIVIQNNEMYFRFSTCNMFEVGGVKNNKFNKELIQKYYFVMKCTYSLINEMINIIDNAAI